MRRRDFLLAATALGGGLLRGRLSGGEVAAEEWDAGSVAHVLPTVSHDRALLKLSLHHPLLEPPSMRIGRRSVLGRRGDSAGRFWSFDVEGLEPDTRYELALRDGGGAALCDAWSLGTFPRPQAAVEHLRLLVYTCAGGHEGFQAPDGRTGFLPLAQRRALLRRGLSFAPHAVVAIGDHVYWDLQAGPSAQALRASPLAQRLDGVDFARDRPVLGPDSAGNEGRLTRVVDPQIAELYGTELRSTPVFFLFDDHDYFENDHADDSIVTFPPDPFMLRLARATQLLYYPELLPDAQRPPGLGGSGAADRAPGVAECFGTLRFGRLAELLLYDCRRYLSLKGPSAGFVPRETESWLIRRTAGRDTAFVTHVPSTPLGWSAGKWGEWYPDLLQADGTLGTATPKPYWQPGWLRQHDRLVEASTSSGRLPLFVSGDLHAIGEGRILRSGERDLRRNPVVSILSGPLGTGDLGWPSVFRGVGARPSSVLEVEEGLAPQERNGFTLLDYTPDRLTVRFFSWRPPEPPEAIETLEPFHTLELAPSGADG